MSDDALLWALNQVLAPEARREIEAQLAALRTRAERAEARTRDLEKKLDEVDPSWGRYGYTDDDWIDE